MVFQDAERKGFCDVRFDVQKSDPPSRFYCLWSGKVSLINMPTKLFSYIYTLILTVAESEQCTCCQQSLSTILNLETPWAGVLRTLLWIHVSVDGIWGGSSTCPTSQGLLWSCSTPRPHMQRSNTPCQTNNCGFWHLQSTLLTRVAHKAWWEFISWKLSNAQST